MLNRDPLEHTSTSADGLWASPLIPPEGFFEHTFDDVGTYNYFCTPHPFMEGVIVVKENPKNP